MAIKSDPSLLEGCRCNAWEPRGEPDRRRRYGPGDQIAAQGKSCVRAGVLVAHTQLRICRGRRDDAPVPGGSGCMGQGADGTRAGACGGLGQVGIPGLCGAPRLFTGRHNRSRSAGALQGALRGVKEWRLAPGRSPLTRASAGLLSWIASALATQILLRWFIAVPFQFG